MVFCNDKVLKENKKREGHNPYFNRWFSAITGRNLLDSGDACHNPYFNRWFSAIS